MIFHLFVTAPCRTPYEFLYVFVYNHVPNLMDFRCSVPGVLSPKPRARCPAPGVLRPVRLLVFPQVYSMFFYCVMFFLFILFDFH